MIRTEKRHGRRSQQACHVSVMHTAHTFHIINFESTEFRSTATATALGESNKLHRMRCNVNVHATQASFSLPWVSVSAATFPYKVELFSVWDRAVKKEEKNWLKSNHFNLIRREREAWQSGFGYLTSAIIIIINGSSEQLAKETWTGRDRSPHRFRSHRLVLLQFHLDEAHLFTCSSKCDIFIKARQRRWGAERKKKT